MSGGSPWLFAFAVTLAIAVLLSETAQRSVLSTTVLFLGSGILLGSGLGALPAFVPTDEVAARYAELALVAVLFTDGMHLTTAQIRESWRLPGRTLFIGMPLTLAVTAFMAHAVAGVSWSAAWLTGAALAPTDPVMATAILGRPAVPQRVRRLLNVESGLNDGLALPIVVWLLAAGGTGGESGPSALVGVALGVALGWSIAWVVVRTEKLQIFGATRSYEAMGTLAIGLLAYSAADLLGANTFLAAFVAGITVASCSARLAHAFGAAGELLSESLKLAAVLVFGALLARELGSEFNAGEALFGVLVLVAARPLALLASLLLSPLSWRERLTVAWFGPKGFASVFFGVLILHSGMPEAPRIFRLVALAIAASMIAHSSTDVAAAHWLARVEDELPPGAERAPGAPPVGAPSEGGGS